MLYVLHAAILVIWSSLTVFRRPLKPYVVVCSVLSVLAHLAELITVGFFRLYEFRGGLAADPFLDTRRSGTLTEYVIFPLTACLFCYYFARKSNWWIILGASLLLSLQEILYMQAGQLIYHGWSLAYSFAFYPPFFWMARKLHNHHELIPPAVAALFAGAALLAGTDLWFHGGFALWRYNIFLWRDLQISSRIFGYFYNVALAVPALWLRGLWPESTLWRIAGPTLFIMAVASVLLVTGLREYHGWNPYYETLRVGLAVWALDATYRAFAAERRAWA